MAKEKEPKAHQLYKQIHGTTLTVGASVEDTTATNGWEPSGIAAVVNRSYIDISAWSQQELTTFTQGIDIQNVLTPTVTGSGNLIYLFDFVTTRRLTDAELNLIFLGTAPGFLPSTADLMDVIYGERMIFASNISIPGSFVLVNGDTFGSGNPTAMNKIHWTRFAFLGNAAPDDDLSIYPANLIVQALTVEEKDLVWMERLRRSYVLQNPDDV